MNAFSKIDMGEVTRLTQVGKLAEAMALLQGHTASSIARPGSELPHWTPGIKRPSSLLPTIDMVAPSTPGGAWTAPPQFQQRAASEFVRPVKAVGPPDLAQMMQAFRGLPKLGALSSVGDGLGPARQAPVHVPEGARFEERTFSNAAGSRTYKVYVPSGYSGQSLPVVVMLHGCTQNPDDFAAGTRMNEVAEEQTIGATSLVVTNLPLQRVGASVSSGPISLPPALHLHIFGDQCPLARRRDIRPPLLGWSITVLAGEEHVIGLRAEALGEAPDDSNCH
jgi:hypothetical protein